MWNWGITGCHISITLVIDLTISKHILYHNIDFVSLSTVFNMINSLLAG